MDNLQHLKPGDPIRATMLNAVIDGAKIARDLSKTGAATGTAAKHSNVLVRILNATGEDLERFAVTALSEPIFEPDNDVFFQEPAFRGTKPESETKNFAILQTPALENEIVFGCVAGVSVVKIDVQDESDEYVTPKSGETIMESNTEGVARIVWKESGTGEKWGLVLYPVGGVGGGGEPEILATVIETISCPPERTKDPSDQNFFDSMGKVRIMGKLYDEENPQYDMATCLELASDEKLVAGQTFRVKKSSYLAEKNDDDDDENNDENNERQELDYYIVTNPPVYFVKLDQDVFSQGNGSFTIRDEHETEFTFNCSGLLIPNYSVAKGQSIAYEIQRRQTNNIIELVIIGGQLEHCVNHD